MAYLIDTNVVSETLKPRPERRVVDWIGRQMANESVPCVDQPWGTGARRPPREGSGREGNISDAGFDHDLAAQFQGWILPFDRDAAVIWGEIMGGGERTSSPETHGRCADRCRRHGGTGLTLATPNIRNFADMEVALFDP